MSRCQIRRVVNTDKQHLLFHSLTAVNSYSLAPTLVPDDTEKLISLDCFDEGFNAFSTLSQLARSSLSYVKDGDAEKQVWTMQHAGSNIATLSYQLSLNLVPKQKQTLTAQTQNAVIV